MTTQRLSEASKGVYIIAVTPFFDDGALDLESTDRLVDFYLASGVHGITLLGMMGEAPKLSREESLQLVRRVLQRIAGRIPVVIGVSNPGLANLASFARETMDLGAAGVMVAPVAGLKTDEQIYDYFSRLCQQLGEGIPVCYQDYPQATDVFISVATFNRLVDDFAQLVMLKHEDCPGLRKLSQIRQGRDGRRRVSILVGNGGLYLLQELARGADGAMTGFAFPEMLVGVYERFARGEHEAAEDLYDAYLPLVRYEQQPGFGLAVRKEILRRRGIIRSAHTRAPGPRLDTDDHRELDRLLQRLERKLKG